MGKTRKTKTQKQRHKDTKQKQKQKSRRSKKATVNVNGNLLNKRGSLPASTPTALPHSIATLLYNRFDWIGFFFWWISFLWIGNQKKKNNRKNMLQAATFCRVARMKSVKSKCQPA